MAQQNGIDLVKLAANQNPLSVLLDHVESTPIPFPWPEQFAAVGNAEPNIRILRQAPEPT
jgi:hypothetical protein